MRSFAWGVTALWLGATSGLAETLCQMKDQDCTGECPETAVRFAIDPNQFVAPLNPSDPPRRQVTTVTMGDATFVAEAILMDSGAKGFFEEAGPLGSRLMIVRPDGSARLVLQPANTVLTGRCEEQP